VAADGSARRGASIGPDLLTGLAGEASNFIAAVRTRSSRHVLVATLTDGDTFPALRAGQKDEFAQLYDLTTEIPVLRTLQRSEIRSLTEGGNWSHEAVVRPYSDDDLAAIFPFLQWLRNARK